MADMPAHLRDGLAKAARWCPACQAWEVFETLEDGTRECVICRLRQERQRELQPALLDAPDDPKPEE
jgi:hypothetical protein